MGQLPGHQAGLKGAGEGVVGLLLPVLPLRLEGVCVVGGQRPSLGKHAVAPARKVGWPVVTHFRIFALVSGIASTE